MGWAFGLALLHPSSFTRTRAPSAAQSFLPHTETSSDKSYGMKYLLIFLTNVDLINYQDFFMKWLLTSMAVC